MRWTQERNFCAGIVPSNVSRGVRQLSHPSHDGCVCCFAKVSEQSRAPAVTSLGVMNHLLKLRPRDSRFGLAFFVDEMELLGHIACAEQQHAFTRQPVAAGAPGLLIIALQIFRQIVMHHEANVWFVDAHSKRNRRGDHPNVVAQKRFLILRALGTR